MSETFLVAAFNRLSLQSRREVWEGTEDTEEATLERILLLWDQTRGVFDKELAGRWGEGEGEAKHPGLAASAKDAGNKAYSCGDHLEALARYNEALRLASPGETSGLVLGNRSAVWAGLGKHGLVERDVEEALEEGVPGHVVWRLLERRGRARWALGEQGGALQDLEQAVVALGSSTLKEEKRQEKKVELQKLMKEIKSSKVVTKNVVDVVKLPELPGENPLYPTFSDAVSFVYEEGRGRYAVAARQVRRLLLLLPQPNLR